jgi:hypothetical protein
MNYTALYALIKDTSLALGDDVKHFHGRKELITLTTDVDRTVYVFVLPFVSSGSLTSNTSQVNETWQINVIFYQQDRPPSGIDQNDQDNIQQEIEILTRTNDYCDTFIRTINEADDLLITNFSKGNAIKDTAHQLTGTTLSMSLRVFDTFNYCGLIAEGLEFELEGQLLG